MMALEDSSNSTLEKNDSSTGTSQRSQPCTSEMRAKALLKQLNLYNNRVYDAKSKISNLLCEMQRIELDVYRLERKSQLIERALEQRNSHEQKPVRGCMDDESTEFVCINRSRLQQSPRNASHTRFKDSILGTESRVITNSWLEGFEINSRPHLFTKLGVMSISHCDVCYGCIGIFGKRSSRCIECGVRTHVACESLVLFSCIPRTPIPRRLGELKLPLTDYCPITRPMIPSVIIQCAALLERDRLNDKGIYFIPGYGPRVTKVLNELKCSHTIPELKHQFTETITSCIKQFLKQIRDSLIPSNVRDDFIAAAEAGDINELNNLIFELPISNMDTLAYLCAHFQKVLACSLYNTMTLKFLAFCVAPVIVGPNHPVNALQRSDRTKKQVTLMLALLEMPSHFWNSIFSK